MAKGAVVDLAHPVLPFPRDRHDGPVDPRRMLTSERRCRQDLVRWIDVKVVLLRVHPEIADPRSDRIVMIGNVHGVIDDVAGMGNPLTAYRELVFGMRSKGIGHPAVPAAETGPAFPYGPQQSGRLVVLDRALRDDGHDQIGGGETIGIQEDIEIGLECHVEAMSAQDIAEQRGGLPWLMPFPTAPHDERAFSAETCGRFGHGVSPLMKRARDVDVLPIGRAGGVVSSRLERLSHAGASSGRAALHEALLTMSD